MPSPIIAKESFDAALLPGVREQLAEAYRSLRQSEDKVFCSVLDQEGMFHDGVAHVRDCPLCRTSSQGATLLYSVHGMHIVRCRNCDFVYSREVINRDVDDSRYRRSDAMEAHMALHTNATYAGLELAKARYIVGNLQRSLSAESASLLDIGSSTGALLQAAREIGWHPLGIELNGRAVGIARARGYEVIEGSFPSDLPSKARVFEVITMLDVLEHAEEPVEFLGLVTAHLIPGGLLAIQVPNFNSLLIQMEGTKNNNLCHGHWSYFTAETLRKVTARAGLQELSIETIISEIDRIQAYPSDVVLETARSLTAQEITPAQLDHSWLHDQLLGYKLFGIFATPQVQRKRAS